MAITGLGHTGVWVYDLEKMQDFYENVLGLHRTDGSVEEGMIFYSQIPDQEHHEFVVAKGRTAPLGSLQVHQISWRVESMDDIVAFHKKFKQLGIEVQQEVTHGNAVGIYFFDPEGNRNEVYLRIDRDVKQPYRKTLNLEQPVEEIYAEMERLLADGGPDYQPVTTGPSFDEQD